MRSKLLYFCLLIILSFIFISDVNAETGKINSSNGINLRESPSTTSGIVIGIPNNATVYISNLNAGSGNGCNGTWYNITYNSKTGYGCSSYINIVSDDSSYLRPWTSPKKSIMGGALWMSDGYINKGQFTSYLKKFNVNPNGRYQVYNHQYMANLAAPMAETDSSIWPLRNNNLLDYPYNFTIPVFNNMPESTWVDGIWKVNKYTSDKKDSIFEESIKDFPESYKPYLRYFHEKHNSWTFEVLQTGLDFNEAYINEKNISSIQISKGQCEQNPYTQTESGWCIGNEVVTKFFLDPRNYFSEANVFVFQDLSYKDIYNENAIQGVLNNTFMSGTDKVDNQKYSSIFMEAGKNASISPLYLASLAKQESGTTEKSTTSGAPFTYNGISYSGLYNFFNIGAYSSESNPALAGLVWASNGNGGTPTNEEDSGGNNNTTTGINFITALGVRQTGDYIRGYNIGTTVGNIKSYASNLNITIKDSNGNVKGDNDPIGTGYTITASDNSGTNTYTYVMYGDLTGDGVINSADIYKLIQYLLGMNVLSGPTLKSAYVDSDSKINSADIYKIIQYLLGKENIEQ